MRALAVWAQGDSGMDRWDHMGFRNIKKYMLINSKWNLMGIYLFAFKGGMSFPQGFNTCPSIRALQSITR